MKIYFSDQKNNLRVHLDQLSKKKIMIYDKSRLPEKVSTIDLSTNGNLENLDLSCLFDYNIFPENIMTYLTEWGEEKRDMKVGDNIVQQVYLPPFRTFSQKIVFGVRISEIINLSDKKGFSYETLDGHVERGISTFTIEQKDNKTFFKIQTFSTPANSLAKLFGPIFSVPYQSFCTKSALRNVKRQMQS